MTWTHTRRAVGASPLLVCLAACAMYPRIPCPPEVTPALGQMRDGYAEIGVLFVTNRRVAEVGSPRQRFSQELADDLTWGQSRVSIPADHLKGGLEDAGLFGLGSAQQSVKLLNAEPFEDEGGRSAQHAFFSELNARLETAARSDADPDRGPEILVYIHGYQASVEEALRQTAQLAHDIRFDGVPIAFCWPTQGAILAYFVDSTTADRSIGQLTQFLDTLVKDRLQADDRRRRQANDPNLPPTRIHLLAHSMGTRLLSESLLWWRAQLHDVAPGCAPPVATAPAVDPSAYHFQNVILAAADIDSRAFGAYQLPALIRMTHRITLYFSEQDLPLAFAEAFFGYRRVGNEALVNLDCLDLRNVDPIDVTGFDRDFWWDFWRHLYFHRSPRVLDDLAAVLDTRAAPWRRRPGVQAPPSSDDKKPRRLENVFFYRMKR